MQLENVCLASSLVSKIRATWIQACYFNKNIHCPMLWTHSIRQARVAFLVKVLASPSSSSQTPKHFCSEASGLSQQPHEGDRPERNVDGGVCMPLRHVTGSHLQESPHVTRRAIHFLTTYFCCYSELLFAEMRR